LFVFTCPSERYPTDFAFTFIATQSLTINKQFKNSAESQYLLVGKNTGESKNRMLFKFDTRRITRRAIVHTAFLYLYLVDIEHDTGVSSLDVPPNNLEVYQILSTDWSAENTTSVIPWHVNYLAVGSDVDARYVHSYFLLWIIVSLSVKLHGHFPFDQTDRSFSSFE